MGQELRLEAAGMLRLFEGIRSGRGKDREGPWELLAYARPSDTLAVMHLVSRCA